jgi:imidazolonepropionase-like amidohydrolase
MLLLAAQAASGDTPPAVPPATEVFQITHVRVIDGTGRAPVDNATITVRGSRIVSIAHQGYAPKLDPGAKLIDGTGDTLIPGLINAHGHLAQVDGTKNSPSYYTREHVLDELRLYERYGVTTMLALGLNKDLIYDIRKEQRAGQLDGATVFVADHGIGAEGGAPPVDAEQVDRPKSTAEARKDVDEAVARHTDFIKIWVDDLYGTRPKMDPAIESAVIDEAHKHATRVASHEYYLADAKRLVGEGVDVLAHSVRDVELDEALIAAMKRRGTYYIPTLTVDWSFFGYTFQEPWMKSPFFQSAAGDRAYALLSSGDYRDRVAKDKDTPHHKQDFETASRNLKKAYDAGVKVGFGTDSGANVYRVPGAGEHQELALMVAAGLTPMQALRAATQTNAALLGISAQTGTLAPGKNADFILVMGNPLEDIRNTSKIVAVWHQGRRIEPAVPATE